MKKKPAIKQAPLLTEISRNSHFDDGYNRFEKCVDRDENIGEIQEGCFEFI